MASSKFRINFVRQNRYHAPEFNFVSSFRSVRFFSSSLFRSCIIAFYISFHIAVTTSDQLQDCFFFFIASARMPFMFLFFFFSYIELDLFRFCCRCSTVNSVEMPLHNNVCIAYTISLFIISLHGTLYSQQHKKNLCWLSTMHTNQDRCGECIFYFFVILEKTRIAMNHSKSSLFYFISSLHEEKREESTLTFVRWHDMDEDRKRNKKRKSLR